MKKLYLGCECGGGVHVYYMEEDEKAAGDCEGCGKELVWIVNPAPLGLCVSDDVKVTEKFGG